VDAELHAAIARRDSIVLVKGARQMGKTSLLARGLQRAREAGARVVVTDFQTLGDEHFESAERLLAALADALADQLDLDVTPGDAFDTRRGPSFGFKRFVQREALGRDPRPLVWGLDEVDRVFAYPYSSEVFGLFRSWHNARAFDPGGPWNRLTLAIAYATEAHLFIRDPNQSPFNVGTRLALADFTRGQVADLNGRYGSPLSGDGELDRFYALLGGHPYMVRRALHHMATRGAGVDALEAEADSDDGPLGDHLRHLLLSIRRDAGLVEAVRAMLAGHGGAADEGFYLLRSLGAVSGETPREMRPRCALYERYLRRRCAE
jgi:hypothetical protein